jgi:uncharacterized membrane protein
MTSTKKSSTRHIVMAALIAAIYAVLTVALAPISFGVIQFRFSEILKVFVLFDPFLAFGIGLGTFMANTFSPMVGPWELIWMPLTDMLGGFLAWGLYQLIRRKTVFPSMILYAITTGLAVGLMLSFFGFGAWFIVSLPIMASEVVLLVVGAPIVLYINNSLKAKGIDLSET